MLRKLINLLMPSTTDRAAPIPRPLWTIENEIDEHHRKVPDDPAVTALTPPPAVDRVLLYPDANFIVWHKGLRGLPFASLDHYDPRRSLDWDVKKQGIVAIYPLTDDDRAKTFAEILRANPCPAKGQFE